MKSAAFLLAFLASSSSSLASPHLKRKLPPGPLPPAPPPNMLYFGGPVISNVKPYAVMWTSGVSAAMQAKIPGFLQALTNSDYIDWLSEYDTALNANSGSNSGLAGTQQHIGRGAFDPASGVYTITPSVTGTTVMDTQVQSELSAQIAAGKLPAPDANAIYVIFFPPGYVINDGTGNSCAPNTFCAYHNTYSNGGQAIAYAILPDFGPGGGCDMGCGPAGASELELLCSSVAHEVAEAITDVDIGLTTAAGYDYPCAWGDQTNGEIGDPCNNDGQITSPSNASTWYVQQLWSNTASACISARTAAQDFEIWFAPNLATLVAGSAAVVPLTVNSKTTAGTAQAVSLSVVAPAGVTGSLKPASLTSGGTATLTLDASAATAAVVDAMTVTSAQGSVIHSAGVLTQVVLALEDFSLGDPAAVSLNQGSSATVAISTSSARGGPSSISLSATGLPEGVTVGSVAPAPVSAGGMATMTLNASAAAVPGTYPFTVVGVAPVGAPYPATLTTEHHATGHLTVVLGRGGQGAGGAPDAGTGGPHAPRGCGCGSSSSASLLALAGLGLALARRRGYPLL